MLKSNGKPIHEIMSCLFVRKRTLFFSITTKLTGIFHPIIYLLNHRDKYLIIVNSKARKTANQFRADEREGKTIQKI